jgi:hypothetical protein
MSMSQEEIEALMNGADADVASELESPDTDNQEDQSVDDIEIEDIGDIDDILANIDDIVDDTEDETDTNVDDILASIDGIELDEEKSEETKQEKNEEKYPLPVEKENKVVDQLNQVAEDSEAKASQIFDVLSYVLDRNDELEKSNKQMITFIESQIELLDSLTQKFPNVEIFATNLTSAKELLPEIEGTIQKISDENNKIFEAMELMQYHDINRQKIERVMAVIRKLSGYLNGIFEDTSNKPEVQIAKHISGDDNDVVGADDIDALINEYS